MANLSKTTQDHDEIRRWAEERGGKPSHVKRTGSGDDVGILRIDFPGYSGEDSLEELSWDDWFEKFDEKGLALLYEEETADGQRSNFNKIVSSATAAQAEEKSHGHRARNSGSPGKNKGAAKKSAGSKGGNASSKKAAGPTKKAATKTTPSAPAKKSVGKKAAPKKAAPKKAAPKKAAPKKAAPKKAAPKKAAPKKAAPKKAAPKKTATKKGTKKRR